jgi:hypothetical protein
VQPVLRHPDRDRRQLGHLTASRIGGIDTIRLGELVRTRPAPLRPMLDDLPDPLRWKQPPIPAFMALLPTPLQV